MNAYHATVHWEGTLYRAYVDDSGVAVCRMTRSGFYERVGRGKMVRGKITDCDAPLPDGLYEALDDELATAT